MKREMTKDGMKSPKPSRRVTRCAVCDRKFKATRRDAAYCSGTCRQRAARARDGADEIDLEIIVARRTYWSLIRRKAEAEGKSTSEVLTGQAQFVDGDGNVFMGGECGGWPGPDRVKVGKIADNNPGWAGWGLDAAGPPFTPPPPDSKRRKRGRRGKP